MRPVSSEDVSDYLDQQTEGAPAHLITITLKSGHVERYTDWSVPLAWEGITYPAGATLNRPAVEIGDGGEVRKEAAGTEIGYMHVTLKCDAYSTIAGKKLPIAALDGDFSGAWVKVERAFLVGTADVLGTMPLWDGPVSEAQPATNRVDVTIDSGMGLLTQQSPKHQHQAGCMHSLFDGGCTLSRATYTVSGVVGSGATVTNVTSDLAGYGSNYFSLGVVTFTSGVLSGTQRGVKYSALGSLALDRPLKSAPVAGVTFTVYPGCDKSRSTCVGKFVNITHFRGEPFVPKNEQGRLG